MTRTSPVVFKVFQLGLITMLCGSSLLEAQADRTPPTTPTNLRVTAITEQTVSLAWNPSTDNSGKFSYYIAGGVGPQIVVSQTQTSHTVTGLQPGRTYTFRVAARDAAGNNSKSSNAVTVTLPGEIPGAPTKPVVQLVNVGPTHASLTWSSSDNGPTIWYTIYINGQQVFTSNSRAGTFTCAVVMVPTYCVPINQSTTYSFTVRARDTDGNLSSLSDALLVTTLPADPNDQTPPTQPSNVTAENIGGFLLVSWNPSTDNLAAQSLIRYDIYVNGELRRVVVGATAAEVDFYVGEDHTVSVVAVDTADNESIPGTIPISAHIGGNSRL
jgi:chitodextrinase